MTGSDNYSFIGEQGVILNKSYDILHFAEGSLLHVDFPQSVIWDIHKSSPGEVYALAHTHPTGMTRLSYEDITTLKAQVFALFPFPCRMITLCYDTDNDFIVSSYLGCLESKESWEKREKKTKRKFYTFEEYQTKLCVKNGSMFAWQQFLIEKSYKLKDGTVN